MFKRHRFPKSILLQSGYFKFRFGLSYRNIEELMAVRGVKVDHATIQRWVFKFRPLLEKECKKRIKISLRFKDFESAKRTLTGIERVHMI